jgi:hypothetical protein
MSKIVIYIEVNLLAAKNSRESVGKFERKIAFQDSCEILLRSIFDR